MRVSDFKKMQAEELKKQKTMPIQKVSNNFIDSTIHKSNLSALKTIFYIATILHDFDFAKADENQRNNGLAEPLNTFYIDLREMFKYTELTAKDIKNNLIAMQETSISFIDEVNKVQEYISLIPRIKFHYGKNKVEFDLYSKIAKLIIKAVGQYSFIDTKQLMRFKNKHSLRLLPVLYKISQYDEYVPKKVTYDLSQLNQLFGTAYRRIADIERFLLKPIKDELDIESELSFAYEVNYTNLGQGRPKAFEVDIYLVTRKHLFN
jgi:hypothetical protein